MPGGKEGSKSGGGNATKKKGGKEGKTGKKGKSSKSGDGDDKGSKGARAVDVLDAAAMENANNICHGVQDLLYFRGFYWDGQNKKGKGKTRKKKGKGK